MTQHFSGILFLFTDRLPTWCMPWAVMGAYSENTLQHFQTMNNKRNSPKTMFPIHSSTLSVMERLPGRPTHHTCIYTMKCSMCSLFLTAYLPQELWAWRECSLTKIQKFPVQARSFEKQEVQNLREVSKVCVGQQYGGCTHMMSAARKLLLYSLSLRMNVDFRNDSLVSCNWPVASKWYHLSSYKCNDAVINPWFIALTLALCDKRCVPLRGKGQNRPRGFFSA